MATVTKENIGLLNDKLTVKISKEDYLPAVEKKIKDFSKQANIPGFRKGMVPVGMVKKMYGASIYSEEIIRTAEKELYTYLETEKPDIFAQPLALTADLNKLDINNLSDHVFDFEIGLKPAFEIASLSIADVTLHKVKVTDEMVQEEVSRMQTKSGKKEEGETTEENAASVAEEKVELNEEFFNQVFPNAGVKTEEEFRSKLKEEIQQYWDAQSKNQLHDQLYHYLLDHTNMEFPESFLKRWLQTGGEKPKSAEEAEAEFPIFSNQLKWTLISDKIIKDNKLEVTEQELRDFMKGEVMRYFGNMSLGDDTSWIESYIDRMLKDEKQVDASYRRLITEKLFAWAQSQVKAKEDDITPEGLAAIQHHHQH